MDLNLKGKTALVTGGSAGIGLACARGLLAEGVAVAIVGRDRDRLAAAAADLAGFAAQRIVEPRVVTVAADLATAEGVTRTVAEARAALGRIDILVNSAGAAVGGDFLTLDDDAYLDAWTLKLLGCIRMTRAVAPEMIARRDGRIVNIAGGAARTPAAVFLNGSTANAAMLNFTRGVAKVLAPHNVRINAISPGTTRTERTERTIAREVAAGATDAEVRGSRLARMPLGRFVEPDEIAAMVALLVSDRVPSMTGGEVVIDGGAQPGV